MKSQTDIFNKVGIILCFVAAIILGTLYFVEVNKAPQIERVIQNNTVQVVYVNVSQPNVVSTPTQNISVTYMTQISAQKLNSKDHPCSSCSEWQGIKMLRLGDKCFENVTVVNYHAELNSLLIMKYEWKRQCDAGNKQSCWWFDGHCQFCGGMNEDGSGEIWCVEYVPK